MQSGPTYLGEKRVVLCLALFALALTGCSPVGFIAGGIALAVAEATDDPRPRSASPVATIDPVSRQLGDITITYTLADSGQDAASITVQHAVIPYPGTADPMETDWVVCTEAVGPGSDGVLNLNTSAPGVSHTYIWDAPMDLGDGTTYGAQFVRIRIIPRDAENANHVGVPHETTNFIAGNDPPTAMVTTPTGSLSRLIQIDYSLSDTTGDNARIETNDVTPVLLVEYTADGGGTWTTATVPVGARSNLRTSPGGVPHNLAWDSLADLGTTNQSVQLRITPWDEFTQPGEETPASTMSFDVTNNTPPIAFITFPVPGTILQGDVDVSYRAIDLNVPPDLVDIEVQYSTDTGTNFSPATLTQTDMGTITGNVIQGVTSSDVGELHTFRWASDTDVPGVDVPAGTSGTPVQIRIRPSDPTGQGNEYVAEDLQLNNNLEPSATIGTPGGPQVGDVTINYVLRDVESDAVNVRVLYSTDEGGAFVNATESTNPISEGITGLSSSPAGMAHLFVWDTVADGVALPAVETDIVFQITPWDNLSPPLGYGIPASTDLFTVDNTSAPTLAIAPIPDPSTGDVTVNYTLTDVEGDPQDIVVGYDAGSGFVPATQGAGSDGTTGLASSPGGTPHVFVWESATDLGPAFVAGVTIRITPRDTKPGAPDTSNLFDVNNNEAPDVVIVNLAGIQSGPVTINYELRDSNADLCEILVEYSVDGGVTVLPATEGSPSDGTMNLASGPLGFEVGHVFLWDSLADLSTTLFSNVRIRITPTDSIGLVGSPDTSNVFTVDNGIPACLVLGKDSLAESEVDGRGLGSSFNSGMDFDGSKLYIADPANHRVLIFDSIPLADFAMADSVLGQDTLTGNSSDFLGPSASSLRAPKAVYSDGLSLYVCDSGNHRVLIWDTTPTVKNAPADHVLGQPDFTSTAGNRGGPVGPDTLGFPEGVTGTASQLFVSDTASNRILVWDLPIDFAALGEGPPADFVLGQADFTQSASNRGGGADANTLDQPRGLHADGVTLFCADTSNHRVLQWDLPVTTDGQAANRVLGQPDFTTDSPNSGAPQPSLGSLWLPLGVHADSGNTYVADKVNHRVLIWSSPAPPSASPANFVLGQPDGVQRVVNNGGISATSLSDPTAAVSAGTGLLIYDLGNRRIKIHDPIPAADNAPAQFVLGQEDFTGGGPNHRGAVFGHTFSTPAGIEKVGDRLFLADANNNRVLGWSTTPVDNNRSPDFVLGQGSFTDTTGAAGWGGLSHPVNVAYDAAGDILFVADRDNHRVLIYLGPLSVGKAASVVLGQPDENTTTPGTTQFKLNSPSGLSWDGLGIRLWVADSQNHRVLRFSPPFASGQPADLRLAQDAWDKGGANHNGDQDGPRSLNGPIDVVSTGSELLVADRDNNRVMVWSALPTLDDAAATFVLGQPHFLSVSKGTGPNRLSDPTGVESDGTTAIVCDAENNRVLIWDTFPTGHGAPADWILGQPDFQSRFGNNGGVSGRSLYLETRGNTSPSLDGTILWVPDQGNNRVLCFDITP